MKNYIKTLLRNKIAILTIDREEALNAMNWELLHELDSSIKALIQNANIRAVIITGRGKKSFIAGADIKTMKELDEKTAYDFSKLGQKVTSRIEQSHKPIIAAINGYAFGGGCEIILSCHLRFASENATFSQPEVKLGLIPGWGGTQRLPKIIGIAQATEMILLGNTINSEKALSIGLINAIFPRDSLIKNVIGIVDRTLSNGPEAVTNSLQCIQVSSKLRIDEGLEVEAKTFSERFMRDEAKEGIEAFINKRLPKF